MPMSITYRLCTKSPAARNHIIVRNIILKRGCVKNKCNQNNQKGDTVLLVIMKVTLMRTSNKHEGKNQPVGSAELRNTKI